MPPIGDLVVYVVYAVLAMLFFLVCLMKSRER